MITFQEMIDLGCIRGSCPIWMTNYLKNSTENNGTVNDENAYGYLLMSTPAEINTSSDYSLRIFYISSQSYNAYYSPVTKDYGVRAVIEINK